MLSRPQTTLLAFLALSSFTQASWFDEALDEIIRRQDGLEAITPTTSDAIVQPVTSSTTSPTVVITETSNTTVQPPTTTTQPPSSTTTTPITTPSETPTTSPTETSTTPPPPTTTEPSSSSSPPSSSPSSSSSEVIETPPSTTSLPPSTTLPVTTPSPTIIRVTQTKTVDGQVVTSVSESTSTIQPTSSGAASLSQSNEMSGSSMSSKTRSTIIGVVVGIGGAILLGGLAVVAYRIWGRKKSREDRDEFLDYSRPDTAIEKAGGSSAGGSSNPFQSTLENYHNPAKVNASSNF